MENDTDQREASAQELIGKEISGRYRIDSLVGLGMMGAVFRAHHKGLGRDVAIKILHEELMADAEMVGRFKREAAAISRLDHPHCVRVTDFGEVETGGMFIAMELLQGAELAKTLDKAMPYERAMQIGVEVLDGLQHAHEQGVIHRDIKPENIYLAKTPDGGETVKILDFGIAKVQEGFGSRTLTQAGMIFGTPHYMSPEQAKGSKLDHRSDLYSVGVLLYDLVAGGVPFDAPDPVKLLRKQITEAPPPLPSSVPEPVQAVIFKLLEKEAEDRPTSAAEAKAAIERAVGLANAAGPEDTKQAPPSRAPDPGLTQVVDSRPSPASDHRMVYALIGASVLVTLIFIVWMVGGDEETPPEETAQADPKELKEAIAGLLSDDDTEPARAEVPDPAPDPDGTPDAPKDDITAKQLRANLVAIDAHIAAKHYTAAQVTIAPLLELFPESAPLHWRMGLVLTKFKKLEHRIAAIQSYGSALAADPGLRNNEQFAAQLDGLMVDPALRTHAIDIAMDHLGEDGLALLAGWVNLQRNPLSFQSRHRVINFLEERERGTAINRPLQLALDLWQAGSAEHPCASFEVAIKEAVDNPDSYLHGTLLNVGIPSANAADGAECEDMANLLRRAQETYNEAFAGLDPQVPAHYRKRGKKRR